MEAFSFKGPFSQWAVYGIPVLSWIIALVVLIVLTAVLYMAKRIVAGKLAARAARTKKDWDELFAKLVKHTSLLFLFLIAVLVASFVLPLKAEIAMLVQKIVLITLLVQAALWGEKIITFFIAHMVSRKMAKEPGIAMTISTAGFIVKVLFYSFILLLLLENIGINVTALIAGLGIGGVAVALAAQNVLGDLFSSLSIVIDKPFVIGDFIIVDDFQGTVEHIGLKTTRVRSLSGEQIVFCNSDLLKSRIRNYKRMYERRVPFSFGVIYQTPYDKLVAIPSIIREAVLAQKMTRFDRAHFNAFGDSSLNFEAVYFVTSPDYNAYMDIHQAINLHIFKRFAEEGIQFAYPTQTLYVNKDNGAK